GLFYGISGAEFNTHGAGQICYIYAPVGLNAANIKPQYVTYYETANPASEGATRQTRQIGMFRDPMPRADGTLWAVHSNEFRNDSPGGPISNSPSTTYTLTSRYDFRIKKMILGTPVAGTVAGLNGGTVTNTVRYVPGATLLASTINKTVKY